MRNFTTEDFSGAGQYLIRNDKEPGKFVDAGFMSTIMKKVVWCNSGKELFINPPEYNMYGFVDMSDGMLALGYFDQRLDPSRNDNPRKLDSSTWIWVPFSRMEVLVDYLNNPELCKQEYRFATQEEVVRVVMYQKSRWR